MSRGVPKIPLKIYRDRLYTCEELCGILRCNLRSVYNYRLEGRFKYVKMGHKYLITGAEIAHLKENGLRETSAAYRRAARKQKAEQREKTARRAAARKIAKSVLTSVKIH